MNPRLKKFKILTTTLTEDKVENLLEGTMYLEAAFQFIDLLLYLDTLPFEYTIVSGFKGYTHYKEQQNFFKDIVLTVNPIEEIKNVVEFLNTNKKINGIFSTVILADNNLKIQLKG